MRHIALGGDAQGFTLQTEGTARYIFSEKLWFQHRNTYRLAYLRIILLILFWFCNR